MCLLRVPVMDAVLQVRGSHGLFCCSTILVGTVPSWLDMGGLLHDGLLLCVPCPLDNDPACLMVVSSCSHYLFPKWP